MSLACGASLPNRFVLAPLTNLQSEPGGQLSNEEFHWLTMRAKGGFGLTMTCAASAQGSGRAWPGQLGAHDDTMLPGLTRLAEAIRQQGSHAVVQIHHGGMRCPAEMLGHAPLCPSDNEETGARAMTLDEVLRCRDDFIAAAVRCRKAGFEGVELHGAHGYLICEFLSAEINHRTDAYGGSPENRARLLLEMVDGVRAECGSAFSLGVRLSPERFGMNLFEIRDLAAQLMTGGKLDYLDMSLWDVFKQPSEEDRQEKSLLGWFTDLPRGKTKLGAAGKLLTAADCHRAMAEGLDFVVIGRAAILRHDFPERVRRDAAYRSPPTPVTIEHLRNEGLSPPFIKYMRQWPGFVEEEKPAA
jgi:2,4-dienoyl-CoA reductase-like NADH-dependent reductase (Old Yellow Enzyme family)